MLITPAFAQTATAAADATAAQPNIISSFLPIVLILVVFFFLVIRPQNKRMMDHRNLVNGLQKGDVVVTSGGLIATVKQVTEGSDDIQLELSAGVTVSAVRSTILAVRNKA